jgi:peptide/nickel transport system substrate-binding protein
LGGSPDDQDRAEIRTFLIADVRGYTLFSQERGDEAAAKLAARFAAISREEIEQRGGILLELRGDEALSVFSSARQALRVAIDLQTRFVEETESDPSLPLLVGIGLDVGEAVPVEGGYRGRALNLAARLCGAAGPGDVLASRETVHLAGRIDGLTFTDRGEMHLKGIAQPVRVIRVASAADDAAVRLAPISARALTVGGRPTRRRPRPAVVLGAVLALVVAVAVPVLLSRGGDEGIAPNSVGIVDVATGEVTGEVGLAGRPGSVAVGEGAVWVTHPDQGTVDRIDPDEARVVDVVPVGSSPAGIAVGEGAVWVVVSGVPGVARISPATNTVVATVPVGNGPVDVAVGEGAVWVTNRFDDSVARVDVAVNEVIATIPVGDDPAGIAVGAGAVWVANAAAGTLHRIDPATDAVVQSIPVGSGPAAVAADDDAIWVANSLDGTVSRIDPATDGVVDVVPVGGSPVDVGLAGGAVWVADEFGGALQRIDPATGGVVATLALGSVPHGVAGSGGSLWVAVRGTATSHRGGTLRVVAPVEVSPPLPLDPATAYVPQSLSILAQTNDGLVGFKRVGGAEGATLVPDLATALPRPADGGRTYTFRVRLGIRYSSGEGLKASDFRRSLERAFRLEPQGEFPVSQYFAGIEGGDACSDRPETCDLSAGVVADDAAGTVAFHLVEPDPDFLYKLALPVAFALPPGVSDQLGDDQALPATGPYMIETASKSRITLVRNPRFRQWSGAAQPDGNPDRIEFEFRSDLDSLVDEVAAGRTDFVFVTPPADRLPELLTRYAGQVHPYTSATALYLSLNTRLPPFDDPRVRRALNLAVDREKVARAFGGPQGATITCQVLPPNFPGYQPYCPFTQDPSASGRWTGPDLEAARKLVEASGTAGTPVTLFTTDALGESWVEAARLTVAALDELGYRAELEIVSGPLGRYFGLLYDSNEGVQVGLAGWIADYPSAAGFIDVLFSCDAFLPGDPNNYNSAEFCDRDVDALIDRAFQAQTTSPDRAGPLWARVDRAITDRAPWVALVNTIGVDFVSARLGGYQHHPQWGVLLGQLWVR